MTITKKTSLVILSLVIIIIVAVFLILMPKKTNAPANSNQTCNPYQDIAVTSKTGDTKGCDCLADIEQKKICVSNITDSFSMASAAQKLDLAACARISDPGRKNSCFNIVQSKIDYTLNLSTTSIPQ